MNSKGFRDEDGNVITIPGTSVKYSPELAGHLAQFSEDGGIEDGGEKSQFAKADHNHDEDYAAKNHGHVEISDFTGTEGAGASVKVEEDPDEQGVGIIKLTVKGDATGSPSDSAKINYDNISNLKRALANPDDTPTDDSDNLITSGAVYTALYNGLAGKFEDIVSESIAFDVSSNALALKSDTSIYAPLFRDATYTFPVEIAVYDSDNDKNVPFIGICKTSSAGGELRSKLFIGERVIVLSKVAATGVVTLEHTYTLGSLLS